MAKPDSGHQAANEADPALATLRPLAPFEHVHYLRMRQVYLDDKARRLARKNNPEAWALIAPAIEVRPAKTSVKVGF
jgi:hypothetical protein